MLGVEHEMEGLEAVLVRKQKELKITLGIK